MSSLKELLLYFDQFCRGVHILVIKHGQNNNDDLTFRIGGFEIKEKTSEKLLGAWIKNDLSWSSHIKKLEDELTYRLYKLRRICATEGETMSSTSELIVSKYNRK